MGNLHTKGSKVSFVIGESHDFLRMHPLIRAFSTTEVGKEEKPGMIIQKYYEYSVGIYYKYDHAEGKYVITTCWKGGEK
jgi:hypothetical protein